VHRHTEPHSSTTKLQRFIHTKPCEYGAHSRQTFRSVAHWEIANQQAQRGKRTPHAHPSATDRTPAARTTETACTDHPRLTTDQWVDRPALSAPKKRVD